MKERIRREKQKRGVFAGVILGVFVVLSLISITLVQNTMLNNADIMGREIVQSFSTSEDANIFAYELLLQNASIWLEEKLQEEEDTEHIQGWMKTYLTYIMEHIGSKGIDMYASIGGKIVAANYWERDDTFDPTQTTWYQQAVEADGEIVSTDAYVDAVTGDSVITIAQKVQGFDAVLAIDLYPQYFTLWTSLEGLPENCSFFLCDSQGHLMYADIQKKVPTEEIQEYVDGLIKQLQDTDETLYIRDFESRKRAVYHRQTSNGWISIITIPYRYLVNGLDTLTIGYGCVFVAFLLFLILMSVRESRLNRQVELTNETVRVLGNSYYAIYRINFETEQYTMLKGSDYIRSNLPPKGNYLDFLNALGKVIEPEAYQDFANSFSIESIQKLVKRKVRDYGGDFLRLFNGEYRWVNVRLLFDESLDLDEAVLCFREVDEEKQRQLRHTQLLKESLDTMKKNAEAKNLFFASMSHDMRTPLNAIIGMSKLAENHLSEPEKMDDYLKKIHHSSTHLLGLINDILEMSKFEQGKLSLEIRPFQIRESVEECADSFRLQASQQGKEFQLNFDIQNNKVNGDLFRIQQILNNLLSNAMKFTKAGDRITLTVSQLDAGNYAKYQFVVQDTGVGMSEDFLQKIFVPFEREVRFGAKGVTGTGLGMSIVHHIVLQMEGEIQVQSALGKGSTFTVTLPLEIEEDAPEEHADTLVEPDLEVLAGRRILLAEDNELNMEISTELLEMLGVQVAQAWNGQQAVDQFEESEEGYFDAILMDMQMPELNGCDAARMIRSLSRSDAKTIPIIAVTANAFTEDVAATVAAGMNAHISKPIDFEILQKTLARFLQK